MSPASTGSSSPVGLTPSQVASYYGLNSITFNSSSGTVAGNGAGVTIAIVDAYYISNIQSELTTFDTALGIAAPPSFNVAFPDGQPPAPPGTTDWAVETALDVEWAHALAPGANILLVETPINTTDLYSGAAYAAQQPGVAVVSMSWGAGETRGETSSDSDFVTPAGHSGVVFVAASGDGGSEVNGSTGVLYPAASPNVLAVGGTQLILNTQGMIVGETGWQSSGGGISDYELQPAYQKGVVTQSGTYRTVPDVSLNAGSPMAIYDSYDLGTNGWEDMNGTSFSSPSWGALIAIADQGAIAAGGAPLNGSQVSSALYSMYTTIGSQSFNDITTGNNGYAAGPGYDLVTGLGSPQAGTVIAGLSGNIATPMPASPSGAINTTAPTFQWSAVSGAVSYQLVAYDQATNATVLNLDVTSSSSYTAPIGTFLPGHSYLWQISAIEANGTSSAISSAVAFNLPAIGVPTLIAPAAGASVYTATPTFQWSAVTGATSYNLEVIDTAAPSSPVINAVVNGTSYTPTLSLVLGHNYSWFVSANETLDGVVFAGSASTSATLSVLQLGTPMPIWPSNKALASTTPIFSWSSVSGAANYVLTLTDLTANTALAPISVTGTSYTPSTPLTMGDSYQWQVQAVDSLGDMSLSSSAGLYGNRCSDGQQCHHAAECANNHGACDNAKLSEWLKRHEFSDQRNHRRRAVPEQRLDFDRQRQLHHGGTGRGRPQVHAVDEPTHGRQLQRAGFYDGGRHGPDRLGGRGDDHGHAPGGAYADDNQCHNAGERPNDLRPGDYAQCSGQRDRPLLRGQRHQWRLAVLERRDDARFQWRIHYLGSSHGPPVHANYQFDSQRQLYGSGFNEQQCDGFGRLDRHRHN